MGIARFPESGSTNFVQPFANTGTYTLAQPLSPGLYKITADTSQTFTTSQMYFDTPSGNRFGAAVKGGLGYISVPETFSSITLSAGSFPLILGFELVEGYKLFPAPSNLTLTYSSLASPWTYSVSYTLASGGTGLIAYYPNGTSQDLGSSTTSASGTLPTAPVYDVAYPVLFAAKDSNGVIGYGTLNENKFPYAIFTTSGTFTKPSSSNSIEILLSGGGGGGGNNSGSARGGGGGGGGAQYVSSATINAPVSVTIGAAGNTGASGGTTNVLNYTQNGGNGGGGAPVNTVGGSGGSSGNGQGGGGGSNTWASGGGGGSTGAGGPAISGPPQGIPGNAGAGTIAPSNLLSTRVSGGGAGSYTAGQLGTVFDGVYGRGGHGGFGAGQTGVVIIRPL